MAPLRRLARRPGLRRVVRLGVARIPVGGSTALRLARRLESWLFRAERPRIAGPAGRSVALPATYQVSPPPPPVGDGWPEAPLIDDPHRGIRSVAHGMARMPPVMDIELFEALNEEYASKPIVPVPPGRDAASRSTRARDRLLEVHRSIGLAGQRVLEFGCGSGYEVWYLAHHFDAQVTGVDIVERHAWSVLADDRTHYLMADLAADRHLAAASFDRILSFAVFEHVVHPHAVMTELFRLLRPGGLAYVTANLYRGPMASHLYHDIHFPWPHLLFTDDVFREYFARRGRRVDGASWVNRLTWAEYEGLFARVGFELLSLRFSESAFDEGFYKRFEGILGRYPRWDLSRDFFHVVARKPGGSVRFS
jgi:SAM-dependent methyltransferase